MKKILAMVLAIVLVASFSIPAFAATTSIDVTSNGIAPIVKCKWETPDALPGTPGTQVAAVNGQVVSGEPEIGCVEVQYWAVVTHVAGPGAISGVYADVYHPNVQQVANITGEAVGDEWCGSFKYQVIMNLYMPNDNDAQIAAFNSAMAAGLVTFGDSYTADDIIYELHQDEAELYMGTQYLCNHQPAGEYIVDVTADTDGVWATPVRNIMTFLELNAYKIDFSTINYGIVSPDTHKWVGGDQDMGTPNKATIWNSGNTLLQMSVLQDDAGFGYSMNGATKIWNVHWDARLATAEVIGTTVNYDPGQKVEIPGVLIMCHPTKLDFSILIDKAPRGATNYTGTLDLFSDIIPFPTCGENTF